MISMSLSFWTVKGEIPFQPGGKLPMLIVDFGQQHKISIVYSPNIEVAFPKLIKILIISLDMIAFVHK